MKKLFLTIVWTLSILLPIKSLAQNLEPYAVLTEDNTVLTFYYDNQKEAREGMSVGPFDSSSNFPWEGRSVNDITSVVFDDSFANCTLLTSTAYWFLGFTNLSTIQGIENLNTTNVTDMTHMFYNCASISSLNLSGINTGNVTNMGQMFYGCSGLTNLNISNFDTGSVTNMSEMFCNCSNINSLDLSSFKTDNVINMHGMFSYCSSLATIYVGEGWSIANVTESSSMFAGCTNLLGGMGTLYDDNHIDAAYAHIDEGTSNPGYFTDRNAPQAYAVLTEDNTVLTFFYDNQIDAREGMKIELYAAESIIGWSDACESITSVVFDASFADCTLLSNTAYWFSGCSNLTTITNIQYLKTDNVINMSGMFSFCSSLTSLDLSGFITDNVTMMESMFAGCTSLTTIYVGEGWSTANVTDSEYMFEDCTNLVGGMGTPFDANHIDAAYAHIDEGASNPGYFTYKAPAEPEPYAVLTEDNTVLTFYYDNQKEARGGMSVGPFYNSSAREWYEVRESITSVVFDASFADCTTLTSTAYWFYECSNLTTITNIQYLKTDNVKIMFGNFFGCSGLTSLDLSGFKTDKVTDMCYMFSDCSKLTSLDLSGFKTDNVTDMRYMFYRCSGLTTLDVSSFKTDNVTNMDIMFNGCSGLTSLDVSGFKTDKVTTMREMFRGCSKLISLDVSSFNTANVTDMYLMFCGCTSLTSLDVSSFKTDNVTNMYGMFWDCSGLTSLDISGFKTANVTNMSGMFTGCTGLTTIYVGDGWSTENVTSSNSMFNNCNNLKGGQGTEYSQEHTDATYAHIDEGTSNPGYFTDINAPLMVEMPTISFANNTVTIITASADANIYYTLDGSTPSTSSELYTGSITLTQNCIVRAIAAKDGMDNSEEAILEVVGLTKVSVVPTPVISQNLNDVTIIVPGISENSTDVTSNVAVEPAAWGGSAPNADLSGEWTCTVLDDNGEPTDSYTVILNEDGKAEFPGQAYVDGGWSYNNGNLSLNHYLLLSGDNYNYANYSLTTTTPNNPMEFSGTKTSTYGNAWTENNNSANVILTYNGGSIGVPLVSTSDSRETTVAVVDEGSSENAGILLQQTISGLENGYYIVELYAKSSRSSAQSMATDVTSLFANNVKLFIPLEADKVIREHNVYQIGVEVTDGTLLLGLSKEKNGANWHALQIKSLTWHPLTTAQPMEEANIYYTLDGTDPTSSSTQFTDPFSVTQDCTVKAIALADDYQASEIAVSNIEFIPGDPEPYAVLSQDNTVLTFYYDAQKEAREGMNVGPFHNPNTKGWYEARESITSVVFDASFADCTNLTSTAFWFSECSNLTTITDIQYLKTDNVMDMRDMFKNCSGLTSLDVSGFKTDNVTDMSWMFYECQSLTSLDLSGFKTDNVMEMYGMFYHCSGLTTLDVSSFKTDNVTDMRIMFCNCSGLTSLDLSGFKTDNVTSMYYMFSDCSKLTSLDLSSFNTDNVTDMWGMFSGCSDLTTIYTGSGWSTKAVTESGQMFLGCTNLVGGMGTPFDANHTDATYAHIDGGNANPGYFTDKNPNYVDGLYLTYIINGLEWNYKIVSVANQTCEIGNSNSFWTAIPNSTQGEVEIPSIINGFKVISIGNYAFYQCDDLTGSLVIPEGVVSIGYQAFKSCTGYTGELVLPSTLKTIGEGAFGDCSNLTGELRIPNSVEIINGSAFSNCSSLTGPLNFPENLQTLGAYAFSGCSSLTGSLVIPELMTEIGAGTFQRCSGMTGTLTIPDGVTSIGERAFNECGFTGELHIPNSVTSIDGLAFDGCKGFTGPLVLPENLSVIGSSIFSGCTGFTGELVIPESLTSLNSYGYDFNGCSGLTSLVLHSGLVSGSGAYTFSGCTGLQEITAYMENPFEIRSDFFDSGNYQNAILYVPVGKVEVYQNTPYWNLFQHIQEIGSSGDAEPYAVLSNNNTVLTFYYDDKKEAREGMSVGPFVSDYERGWYEARESITSVVFDASFADCTTLTSTAYWFASCSNLTTITDIQYLKTDNVTDMRYMFIGCSELTTLDLSSFSTSNVTNMGSMFYGCSNLATIYASYDWDNSHVTNGDNMFYGCYNLKGGQGTVYEPDCTNVGFAHIDEGTAYPGYFTDKNAPQPYAVLSEGNTVLTFYYDDQKEAREGMSVGPFTSYNEKGWFEDSESITSVVFDASFADCTTLTSTSFWFRGCSNLTSITNIQYLKTDNVKKMGSMFSVCSSLTSLDLSSFNTSNVTDMYGMFADCTSMTSLDLSGFNTTNVTNMYGLFYGCSSLTTIYVGEGWSTANVTNPDAMFSHCTNLVGGMGTTYDANHIDATYAHIDGGTNNPGYFTDKNGTVVIDEVMAYVVLSDNMRKMTLYYDKYQESHTEGPVILWSELQASHEMINARETLVTIDFDPSFAGLTTLTSTNYLFSGCRNLTAINGLEYLVTDNMTDMNEMFVSCESLTVLDLSSFNTSKVTSMFGMFMDCRNLTTIIVGDGWDISALTDGGHEMFAGCTSLVGGMGTTYSDPNFNADYAHVDGGPSNPGYLTGTDEPDITEFEVDGIWYRVRPRGEHEVFVAHVMYGDQEIYIPSEVEYARSHWRVTALGERAFADLHEVTVIEVPESIDSISIDLFNHCNHLAAIIWQASTPLTTAAMGEFNNPNLLLYVREKASAPATITNIVDMTNFTADKIVLSDAETGNDFYCPEPFMAKEISYTHSYDQATRIGVCQGWESIVLPFDVQTFMHETKGEIYPIASLLDEQIEYDGDKPFWLYEFTMQGEFREAEQIRANTPYIISMPNDPAYWDSYILSGKVTFKSTNVEVYPTHHAMYVEGGNRVFVPNFANADYSNPDAYLLNVGDAYEGHLPGSVFSAERENRRARPFEAYFYYNGQHPAKRYIGVFDEDASAIREIPVSSKTMKGAYDLAGRKVDAESQLPKGVYIIDGKKVMVK